jgi:hypothetical protein
MKLTLISIILVVLLQFAACAPRKSQRTQKSLEPASDSTSVKEAASATVTRQKKQDTSKDDDDDSDEDKYVLLCLSLSGGRDIFAAKNFFDNFRLSFCPRQQ